MNQNHGDVMVSGRTHILKSLVRGRVEFLFSKKQNLRVNHIETWVTLGKVSEYREASWRKQN